MFMLTGEDDIAMKRYFEDINNRKYINARTNSSFKRNKFKGGNNRDDDSDN
jgi:hypothetical protein